MNRQTLTSYLEDFRARGGEIAFAHRRGVRRERWSYARVAGAAYGFARELEGRGIGRGERVLFWAENSAEWVAAFFGCLVGGVIVVPLDVESAPDFVERVRRQTGARLLLRGEDERCRPPAGVESLRLAELSSIVARRSTEPYETGAADGGATAEIIYTSGTTAEPKGVVLTHANLLANLLPLEREIKKYLRWERLVHPVRFLNLLPLSHVFGQFMGIFVPQLLGGEVHFQSSLNPTEITERVRRERISVVVTVPRVLEALRERVEREQEARGAGEKFRRALAGAGKWGVARRWWVFRGVRREFGWKFWAFVSGGATLRAETEDFWQRMGYAVVQGYGMTETASLISVNHPFKKSRGSIGKTLPGQEVRLDETGEIMVRGANVSPGYWSGDARDAARGGDDGWLRTGDLGELDAAGNLFFKGRKKDVIVTGAGVNIHPADLEAALGAQGEVRDCCVVGLDLGRGPEPVAALVLREELARGDEAAAVAAAAAVARANEALNGSQQIRRWVVWPERDFPRTATQKIRKPLVAAALAAQLAGRTRAGETSAALAEAIARVSRPARARKKTSGDKRDGANNRTDNDARGVTGNDAYDDAGNGTGNDTNNDVMLDGAATLETDLKLDSLGRVELMSVLEDRYGVELDESAFTAATTVGDIERMIREGPAASGVGVAGEAGDESASSASSASSTSSSSEYPYPRWARRAPATWVRRALVYAVVFPLVWWMARPKVRGAEHLKNLDGPALFVADHVTRADQALVLWALPRRFRHRLTIAMEGELLRDWRRGTTGASLFTRALGLAQYALVVTFFNVFPLPKRSGFRRSFAYAGESADRGLSLLVFPEGRRTDDGRMRKFMAGTGLLAADLDLPVVPVKLDGLFALKREARYFARPGELTIRIGEPVVYERGLAASEIAADLERRVAELEGK